MMAKDQAPLMLVVQSEFIGLNLGICDRRAQSNSRGSICLMTTDRGFCSVIMTMMSAIVFRMRKTWTMRLRCDHKDQGETEFQYFCHGATRAEYWTQGQMMPELRQKRNRRTPDVRLFAKSFANAVLHCRDRELILHHFAL